MNINMLLSAELIEILNAEYDSYKSYAPAYDGESVGLDLFNAGPDIVIPPAQSLINSNSFWLGANMSNPARWLDIHEEARKSLFKRLMPTGVFLNIPRGYGGFIMERGSITKTPLKVRAGVIDPGYTGEVFVNMVNVAPVSCVIPSGAKSPFQLVIKKVSTSFNIVDAGEFEALTSNHNRKDGKIGSSD